MMYLELLFVLAAAVCAILSVVQSKPILWISVILLCVVEALHLVPR